jgi:hypothetical protein
MKEKVVMFVADDQPAIIEEPCDRLLDLPAAFVTLESSPVLRGWSCARAAVRANQLDPAPCQSRAQGVAVGGTVIEEPPGTLAQHTFLEEALDQRLLQPDWRWRCRRPTVRHDRRRAA